jgi:tetratricopeptide (TPR) repeat protein
MSGQQPPPPPPDDDISRRIYNTAPAEHDVEVGQYYMKKEKYDAAVDRFKHAIELLPKYSLPYRLLGEAYEKKHFYPEALAAYQKYVELFPKAGDAENVRKRITRLQETIRDQEKRREKAAKP